MFMSTCGLEGISALPAGVGPFLHQGYNISIFKICGGIAICVFQNLTPNLMTFFSGHFQHGADVQTDIASLSC